MHSTRFEAIARSVRTGIAFVLLSFYILEGTPLAKVSPQQWFPLFRVGTENRVLLSMVATILCLGAFAALIGRRERRTDPVVIAFGVWIGALTLGVLFAPSIAYGNASFRIECAVTVGVLASQLTGSRRSAALIFVGLVFIQGIVAFILHAQSLDVNVAGSSFPRLGGSMRDPNAVCTMTVAAIPLVVGLCFDEGTQIGVLFYSVVLACLSAVLVLSGFLPALIAIVVSLLFAVSLKFGGRMLTPMVVALLCLGGFIASGRYRGHLQLFGSQPAAVGLEDASRASRLLGGGPTAGIQQSILYSGDGFMAAEIDLGNALSAWWNSWGIAGALALVILARGLLQVRARLVATPSGIWVAASLMALGLTCITDAPFGIASRPTGTVCFSVALGLILLTSPKAVNARDVESGGQKMTGIDNGEEDSAQLGTKIAIV